MLPREDRELPAVVAQWGGAVHRRAGRVAVEPLPVDLGPGLEGAALEPEVQARPCRAGPAVGGDHVAARGLPDLLAVRAGMPDGQIGADGVLVEPGALVPVQDLDVRVAVDPGPQRLLQRGLVYELLACERPHSSTALSPAAAA